MPRHVVVLGGGIAGLTAAHELCDRGFGVTVLESGSTLGGKSRSLGVPHSGMDGRRDLPAEHGFRFLPGFYKHLPDTMGRIPYRSGSVRDNLVPASHVQIARSDGFCELLAPNRFPESLSEIARAFQFFRRFYSELGVPHDEVLFFVRRLLQLMLSGEQRRHGDYEYTSWLDYIDASRKSPAYRRYFAYGLSRSLVALDPRHLSTRTGGYILLQFLFDFSARPGTYLDRLLNGPTNDVWIDPWRDYLAARGVEFALGSTVTALRYDGTRIAEVEYWEEGQSRRIESDVCMLCLPVHAVVPLISDDIGRADPALLRLKNLQTSWMTGLFFYLRNDRPIVHGHTNYIDSPWALTSVSQRQFWQSEFDPLHFGDGTVQGIVSVIISNWDAPGMFVNRTARQCTPQELVREVWMQMKAHLNDTGTGYLVDEDVVATYISPSMRYTHGAGWQNDEPLLINTVGSWSNRPHAVTGIDNLYLASDYVRTSTDLATMEGANEAARRAVNGLLDALESDLPRCEVWQLEEPSVLEPLRKIDDARYAAGKPVQELGREAWDTTV